MTPTRTRTIVIIAVLCAAVSWGVVGLFYRRLPPLPWNGIPTLVVVAVVEAYSGRLLRARIHRRPGTKPVEVLAVARMAVLAKATVYTAAVIGGVSAGFFLYLAGSLDKAIPRHDALVSAGMFAAAAVLLAGGLYLEYCCRVPKPPEEQDAHRRAHDPRSGPPRDPDPFS